MVTATETGGSMSSIAGMIAGINGALAGAVELALDAATISQVRQHLVEAQTQLEKAQSLMPAIASSTVGGSWWGSQLSHHSTLAHTRLVETITEMNAGLDHYEAAMQTASKEVGTSDETAGTDFDRGATCTGGPTTTTPLPSCGA